MKEDNSMDKLFDALVAEAANQAVDELGNELPEPEPVEFSKDHQLKMQRLFKRERNKLLLKKISKYSRRAAVVILAVSVVSGVTIFSVEAWRVRFLNFVLEMTQTHTDINFGDEGVTSDSYSTDEITLDYIPNGFKLDKSDVRASKIFIAFGKEEKYFSISINSMDGLTTIDTESAGVRKVSVNGNDAYYSSNNNVNVLVWHDNEYVYRLSGNIGEEEIMKIAKNIKK